MAELRRELQLSVRALLYHIDHRRSHSELNQILPKVGSFEDWLKMRDPEDETGVRDCQIMLQAPPAEAGEEELQLWNEMARMSLPLFIKYKIDKEPLFDTANTCLDVWETDDREKCYGMRHKETAEKHGIVRTVEQNGVIREAQYKNGVLHGLSREILVNSATVAVYREGEEVAELVFDKQFNEVERGGEQAHQLDGLSALSFKLPSTE